jgi:hypothetical protein
MDASRYKTLEALREGETFQAIPEESDPTSVAGDDVLEMMATLRRLPSKKEP